MFLILTVELSAPGDVAPADLLVLEETTGTNRDIETGIRSVITSTMATAHAALWAALDDP